MLAAKLHQLLIPADKANRTQIIAWFCFALTLATMIGFMALRIAFSSEYVVQDDARQHVFWLERFIDPGLFPNDLIANYFQGAAPPGYTWLYRGMAALGIHPLFLAKLLPLILGVVSSAYCFGISLQIFPVPSAAFLSTLLLNLNLWVKDDLASATPRAFLYPFFLAVIYYLLRRSLIPFLVAIALLGFFYPQVMLLSAPLLVLQLVQWENGRLRLSQNRSDYQFCLGGLGVILLVVLLHLTESSEFGQVIKAAEAKTMPEFGVQGRTAFFNPDPWVYWFTGRRSSIRLPVIFSPWLMLAGLSLPLLLYYPKRFLLAERVTHNVWILPQLVLACFVMFFAAQAVLFKLHFPDRYAQHGLRIAIALATGISLMILLDALFQVGQHSDQPGLYRNSLLPVSATVVLAAALFLQPVFLRLSHEAFPATNYQIGQEPALYQFFAKQPKNVLIASLSEEAANLPSFSQRSVLVSREFAVPLHKGYYSQIRQRAVDLMQAQYSPKLTEVQQFIKTYNVTFWLLDREAFQPDYLAGNSWLQQYQPMATDVLNFLQKNGQPALAKAMKQCSVFETQKTIVLPTECILKMTES